MALINCPECGKEVSDTSYKCPNCGFVVNEPKRSITGNIFKFLFIAFNMIMLLIFLSMFMGMPNDMPALAAIMASGMIIGAWLLIGLPLGVMSYITRAKAGN